MWYWKTHEYHFDNTKIREMRDVMHPDTVASSTRQDSTTDTEPETQNETNVISEILKSLDDELL